MVKLVCDRCQSSLSLPGDILPGKDLSGFKCAVCQGPMLVEPAPALPGDDLTSALLLAVGGNRMLVAVAEQTLAESVGRAMSGSDWHIVLAQTSAAALSRLEDGQYDLVVLHERSAAATQSEDPVLSYLQHLPMPLRRTFLVCLLSDQTPTLDYMAAFRAGVDVIVSVQDVEKLHSILKHMLNQHQVFYAKFKAELHGRGTSL